MCGKIKLYELTAQNIFYYFMSSLKTIDGYRLLVGGHVLLGLGQFCMVQRHLRSMRVGVASMWKGQLVKVPLVRKITLTTGHGNMEYRMQA